MHVQVSRGPELVCSQSKLHRLMFLFNDRRLEKDIKDIADFRDIDNDSWSISDGEEQVIMSNVDADKWSTSILRS